jgi:Spy/CpxP family protein refolding chaperone
MKSRILLSTALTFAGFAHAGAQAKPLLIVDGVVQTSQDAQPAQQGPDDPFGRFLFPPELVMQHQGEIGITDAQRATLTTAVQQAQSKIVETQFKLSAEGEKLARLLQGARGVRTLPPTIDEGQALEQVDRILSLEREMKRAQMTLLIRIKNALTPDQQAKLMQLRQSAK